MRWITLLAWVLVGWPAGALAADLEVGQKAPAFTLHGVDGATYSLEQHLGKRGVVLAWFPKAFTPGWTTELAALRDSAPEIGRYDVAYYMVSLDSPEKNAEFRASLDAKFPVISDPDKLVAKTYGVLALGGLYARRWTFYIDPDGLIRKIDKDVNPATAGADVARTLGDLGFPLKEAAASAPPAEDAR